MDLTIKDLSPKGKKAIEIDPALPALPFSLVLYGCMRSGKTVAMMNFIMWYKKYFNNRVFYLAETPDESFDFFVKNIGAEIYTEFTKDGKCIITQILNYQGEALKKLQEKYGKDKGRKKLPHVLIVLDDAINNEIFDKRRGLITRLYTTARHYNISIITTSQQLTMLPSSVRRLTCCSIIFPIYNEAEKKLMCYENCSNIKKSEDEFRKIYDEATNEPYSFLFIDKQKQYYSKRFGK